MPAFRWALAPLYLLFMPATIWAAPATQAYKTSAGQFAKTVLTTQPGNGVQPTISAYKGSDGQWHSLLVTQEVCGLDTNGGPLACANVTANQIGQPSGVAGLDASGNATAPVLSQLLTASPMTSIGQEPLANLGRFPIATSLSDPRMADPFQSPDALYIGGLPTQGWAANGAANNQQTRPGSVVVVGQPWGPFNASTLESLLMANSTDAQNGVCAADWRAGAGHFCGADGVAQYIGVTNVSAMIVGNVASYSANSVVLKTPLTASQMAQLRVGMYITTNTINPTGLASQNSVDSWGNVGVQPQDYYLSVISGWSADGTTINVSGWDIPWASAHPSGQVPGSQSGDALDTWSSNYGAPVVFIGNPNDGSAHNEYLDYQGYKSGDDTTNHTTNVGPATATAHALSGDEIDLRYWATRPNEVHLDGITISVAGDPGTPVGRAALAPDSYGLAISGDIHNSLILDGPGDGNTILSHSFYLHGNEGVQTVGGINRPKSTLFGFTGVVDGDSSYNLVGWLNKDQPSTNGVNGASFHLGIVDNGYVNLPSFDPSQNGAGQIVWNNGGNNVGGLSLCGANGCGLDVAASGAVTFDQSLFAKNGMGIGNGQSLVIYPQATGVGAPYLVADGTDSLSITGTDGSWAHLGVGAISASQGISARTYTETLTTPASSSAPCSAGQFTDDANYHYVCVATNTWKRVALSSF